MCNRHPSGSRPEHTAAANRRVFADIPNAVLGVLFRGYENFGESKVRKISNDT